MHKHKEYIKEYIKDRFNMRLIGKSNIKSSRPAYDVSIDGETKIMTLGPNLNEIVKDLPSGSTFTLFKSKNGWEIRDINTSLNQCMS